MDVGRLCGVLGREEHTIHQRIAEYVKVLCAPYQGIGFTAREEWMAEQTIQGLQLLLADVRCSEEERRAIDEFLTLAAEELAGPA